MVPRLILGVVEVEKARSGESQKSIPMLTYSVVGFEQETACTGRSTNCDVAAIESASDVRVKDVVP